MVQPTALGLPEGATEGMAGAMGNFQPERHHSWEPLPGTGEPALTKGRDKSQPKAPDNLAGYLHHHPGDEVSDTPEQFDDDDDTFHNPDLVERDGLVAIWLNVAFEEDNKTIGWYDHDYEEGSTIGRLQPIRELLTGFSYCETWIDAAVQAAEKLGVTEAYNAWMLFDHEYAAPAGPFEIATEEERVDDLTPYYLGAFHFTP